MEPDFTAEEYRDLAEFRYRLRRFLRFSETAARAHGLEVTQHQLLLAVKALERPTVGELAERVQLRHHSVVGLLDRLAARGLLRRARGEPDRRKVMIELTEAGEEVLRRLAPLHREELRKAAAELVRALKAVLGRRAELPGL
ncbi:MAG: MarR family winged helix-turn-helix transcriptional regulator [Bryobacteraceae bacterium]